jgi:hypothetical protein
MKPDRNAESCKISIRRASVLPDINDVPPSIQCVADISKLRHSKYAATSEPKQLWTTVPGVHNSLASPNSAQSVIFEGSWKTWEDDARPCNIIISQKSDMSLHCGDRFVNLEPLVNSLGYQHSHIGGVDWFTKPLMNLGVIPRSNKQKLSRIAC